MCVGQVNYKGLVIYENINDEFKSSYYSIYNKFNNKHVHSTAEFLSKKIVDCYWHLYNNNFGEIKRYSKNIRNKAFSLLGNKVLFR